jgi:hypothetical protein
MNYLNQKSFYLKKDPELRVVHVHPTCPAAKVGDKYKYLISVTIKTAEDAVKLDEEGLRACDWCLNRERMLRKNAKREPHVSPPGFRS